MPNKSLNKVNKRNIKVEVVETPKKAIGVCGCSGTIVLEIKEARVLRPNTGPVRYGPKIKGETSHFQTVKNLKCYCDTCGLLYNPDVVCKNNKKK